MLGNARAPTRPEPHFLPTWPANPIQDSVMLRLCDLARTDPGQTAVRRWALSTGTACEFGSCVHQPEMHRDLPPASF